MTLAPPAPTHGTPASTTGDRRPVPVVHVLWIAAAAGLVAALWFVLRGVTKVFVLGGFGAFSRDVAWMAPIGHLLLFVTAAIPVVLVTRVMRRDTGTMVASGLMLGLAFHAALLPWTQVGLYAAIMLALGAGWAVARSLAGRGADRVARLARRVALGLVTLFAAAAAGVALARGAGGAPLAPAASGAPNVLLIVFDTFKAGMLGSYGSTRGITPNVDRFATGATVFDWAMASSGWTLPSHATMFTGRYAQRTGVDFETPLGPREPTIAEAFRAHGYETAGFAGNLHYVSWESGLDRGFDAWSDYPRSWEMVLKSTLHGQTKMVERLLRSSSRREFLRALRRKQLLVEPKPEGPPVDAREITDRMLGWMAHRDASRPWFAFINYFDAHRPYLTFTPDRAGAASLDDSTVAGYESDIAYLDTHVGRLLDRLERDETLRNTIVVITADHGEHFGEHGLHGHANSVYTALLHVPLLVRWDGHVPAGQRVRGVVSQRDLARTLVDLAGMADARFPGHSLAATWRDSLAPRSAAVAQHERSDGRDLARPASETGMTAMLDERWHLIRTMRRAIEETFEYRVDREEMRNVVGTDEGAPARDSLVKRLREALVADGRDSLARIGGVPTKR